MESSGHAGELLIYVISFWLTSITLFFANVGVIWWFRKESISDIKEMRKESREDWLRCESMISAIKEEMRDFHERLLKIEMDRNK